MSAQLAFDLGLTEALGAADYLVTPANALVHGQVLGGGWPGGRLLLLGPEGAGKTHLAGIWAAGAGAAVRPAHALRVTEVGALPAAVLVEDADRAAGWPEAEAALFHLWNLQAQRGGQLLVTGRGAPGGWGVSLPDLASRLGAMAQARLEAPDDALLAAVLVKLFADRQLQVQPNLVAYLIGRMERSLAAARGLVADLDARALVLGRPVTRQLAAELLDRPAPE